MLVIFTITVYHYHLLLLFGVPTRRDHSKGQHLLAKCPGRPRASDHRRRAPERVVTCVEDSENCPPVPVPATRRGPLRGSSHAQRQFPPAVPLVLKHLGLVRGTEPWPHHSRKPHGNITTASQPPHDDLTIALQIKSHHPIHIDPSIPSCQPTHQPNLRPS